MLGTTGDLFFIIHDWLFSVEIMMASLTMPIAVKLFNEEVGDDIDGDSNRDTDYFKDKRRVKYIKWLAHLTFCVLTMIWFIGSAVTGSFIWRMGDNVLWLFIMTVFLTALLRIKSMITKMNTNEKLKPNHTLMNINLITFSIEWIISLNIFVLAFLTT